MTRRLRTALWATLLLFGVSHASAAQATPRRVLVLKSETPSTPATFWESFVLALEVQLGSYGVSVAQQDAPKTDLVAAARTLGRARGAIATIWIDAAATPGAAMQLHVLDLTREAGKPRTMAMQPGANIERSLAVAARTLLQAPLAAPPPPSPPPTPSSAPSPEPVSSAPATRPTRPPTPNPPPLFFIGADYVFTLLPSPGELRHGPDVHATLRLWQELELQLSLGVRLHDEVKTPSVRVDRTGWLLSLGAGWRWPMPHGLSVLTGLRGQAGWVVASADELTTGQSADSNLFELALGAETGLAWRLGARLRLHLLAGLQWLARGHDVAVRGEQLTSSGRLAIRLGAGVGAAFW